MLFAFFIKFLYLGLGAYWSHFDLFKDDLFFSFCRNDSFWYELIVKNGYESTPPNGSAQSAYAFFPLYPLLIKPFYYLTGNFTSAAFIFSVFTTIIWVFLQFNYLRNFNFQFKSIFLFTLFYQCFPFHYFFHMYYSEQLFSILLLSCLIFINRNKPFALFLACILLSLCRPTGLIFSFAFIFIFNTEFWDQKGFLKWKNYLRFWPLIGGVVGLAIFQLYSYLHCGDFLANTHAMKAWNRSFCLPWESFMVQPTFEYEFMAYLVLGLQVLTLISVNKSNFRLKIYALITTIFPLTTGSTDSYYRYFAVNFPIFQNLFLIINKYKILFILILMVLMSLNLYAYHYWVTVHGQLSY